jgi:tryptophan synthase alpha subunit
MTALLDHLERRRAGGKLLVPYLMAGAPDAETFLRALQEISPLGDAVEVGLPFSDPLMDGPVIASAGERALRNGVGPAEARARVPDAPGCDDLLQPDPSGGGEGVLSSRA